MNLVQIRRLRNLEECLDKHLIWRFRKHTDDLFIVSRFDQPDRLQSVDIPIIYDSHVDRTIMGAVIDSIEASKNEWVYYRS